MENENKKEVEIETVSVNDAANTVETAEQKSAPVDETQKLITEITDTFF